MNFKSKTLSTFLIPALALLMAGPLFSGEEKKEAEEKPRVLIEEIQITAKAPPQQPISTVSALQRETLEQTKARDLADVIPLSPGVHVSEGQKGEASVNLRGLASNRITLMVDGIPIYEPYFGSFDLKSITAEGIETIKVVKGASSVLYGPNTLGGVIDVITRRPYQNYFNFNGNYSENNTWFLSGNGAYRLQDFSIFSSVTWDRSDGYDWENRGEKTLREWSDHNRRHITTKMYYSPTDRSELMAEIQYTNSEYRIPPATDYFKQRYWYFQDWDRVNLNLGGLMPFAGKGFLKLRSYLVHHYNVLNDYSGSDMEVLRWQSTYKNSALGLSALGEYPFSPENTLKFSFNSSFNRVNTQDDIGAEWERFRRDIYSWGIEDHLTLTDSWQLIGGISLDLLKKNTGETRTSINPIIGIKYFPSDELDLHLSYGRKSRFPSMKSLYSTRSGNPGLNEEIGQSLELGIDYQGFLNLSAAVFTNVFTDLIQSYRGLDGYRDYQNIGKAVIRGFEIQGGKKWNLVDIRIAYTYLDSEEEGLDMPLDYTPRHQVSVFVTLGKIEGFSLSLWGKGVSDSYARMGKEPPFEQLTIPAYFLLNATLEKAVGNHSVYLKVSNALDAVYFSEPGFPATDRRISVGVNLRVR